MPKYLTWYEVRRIKAGDIPLHGLTPKCRLLLPFIRFEEASHGHGFRSGFRSSEEVRRFRGQERPLRHLQRLQGPVREKPLPFDGKVLRRPEGPAPDRFQGHRRLQPPIGLRGEVRLSKGRHRAAPSPGVRRHLPPGPPREMGRPQAVRHRGHALQARPREI